MSQTEGGSGGPTAPGIRTTRLVSRAIRERWPIPQALRGPLIERLAKVVLDPAASPREVVSAARAILTASKINLEGIAATIEAEEHDELAARLQEAERRAEIAPPPRLMIPDRDDRWDRPSGISASV
jgi:hypothetical protein